MLTRAMRPAARQEDDVGGRLGAERDEETSDHHGDGGPGTEGIIHKNDGASRGYGTPHRQRISAKVGRKNPTGAKRASREPAQAHFYPNLTLEEHS